MASRWYFPAKSWITLPTSNGWKLWLACSGLKPTSLRRCPRASRCILQQLYHALSGYSLINSQAVKIEQSYRRLNLFAPVVATFWTTHIIIGWIKLWIWEVRGICLLSFLHKERLMLQVWKKRIYLSICVVVLYIFVAFSILFAYQIWYKFFIAADVSTKSFFFFQGLKEAQDVFEMKHIVKNISSFLRPWERRIRRKVSRIKEFTSNLVGKENWKGLLPRFPVSGTSSLEMINLYLCICVCIFIGFRCSLSRRRWIRRRSRIYWTTTWPSRRSRRPTTSTWSTSAIATTSLDRTRSWPTTRTPRRGECLGSISTIPSPLPSSPITLSPLSQRFRATSILAQSLIDTRFSIGILLFCHFSLLTNFTKTCYPGIWIVEWPTIIASLIMFYCLTHFIARWEPIYFNDDITGNRFHQNMMLCRLTNLSLTWPNCTLSIRLHCCYLYNMYMYFNSWFSPIIRLSHKR